MTQELIETVRTVRSVQTAREKMDTTFKFKVGDYLEIYTGPLEGCCFYVKSIRFNHDIKRFEYLSDGAATSGWYAENCVVKA